MYLSLGAGSTSPFHRRFANRQRVALGTCEFATRLKSTRTSVFKIPKTSQIIRLPKDVDIRNEVGFYTVEYEKQDDRLIVHRQLVLKTRELEPTGYPDLERLIYAAQNDFTAIVTTNAARTKARLADGDVGKSHS
jgi:hypothetical protein